MASTKATKEPGIQFIEGIKGSHYRVQIRLKGCPHLSKNFDSFEEAKKWVDPGEFEVKISDEKLAPF